MKSVNHHDGPDRNYSSQQKSVNNQESQSNYSFQLKSVNNQSGAMIELFNSSFALFYIVSGHYVRSKFRQNALSGKFWVSKYHDFFPELFSMQIGLE